MFRPRGNRADAFLTIQPRLKGGRLRRCCPQAGWEEDCALAAASRWRPRSRGEPRTFQISACDSKHERGSRFPSVGEAAPGRDPPPPALIVRLLRLQRARGAFLPGQVGTGSSRPGLSQPGWLTAALRGQARAAPGGSACRSRSHPGCNQTFHQMCRAAPACTFHHLEAKSSLCDFVPRRFCSAGARRRGGASISSCCSTSASSATAVVFTASRGPPPLNTFMSRC